MTTGIKNLLATMQATADPARLAGMARHGIDTDKRLGLTMPELRALAKDIRPDHELALALWATELHEARILAPILADPGQVDGLLMDIWVKDFDSWDICDQCCMNLFRRLPPPLPWTKIDAWAPREEEFVRRAAFALIATLSVHEKSEPDSRFIALLPLIEAHSDDQRNFIKKAVNWSLRQIGKRNRNLNREAIQAAQRIFDRGSPAARWIAPDALRELQNEKTLRRLMP